MNLVNALHFIGTLENSHAPETGEVVLNQFQSAGFMVRFDGPSLRFKVKIAEVFATFEE